MPSVPRFLVEQGEQPGRAVELSALPFTVGRARDCTCVLDDAGISRVHARCVKEGQSLYLEDAGSTNGTFVNGRRLRGGERHRLRGGDVVTLGPNVTWVFDDPATTAQIDPVQVPTPGLVIDDEAARVTVAGTLLYPPLSPNQFALLALLVENPGRVVEREEIVAQVWQPGDEVTDQTIDALVSRLRKRLHDADPDHEYIVTRRGFGLIFENRKLAPRDGEVRP